MNSGERTDDPGPIDLSGTTPHLCTLGGQIHLITNLPSHMTYSPKNPSHDHINTK